MKEYFMFGFVGAFTFLTVFTVKEVKKAGPTDLPEEVKALRRKQSDPRRPPWPILHERVVKMREGKVNHDDLPLLWEQTKYYYPHDWLIPLEMSQVLKYTTGAFLQNYVSDPEQLKRELMEQLDNVAEGRVKDPSGAPINRDVKELITMAVEDLRHLDLSTGTTLVPVHTR
eukprot:CAMPEP_0176433136 /NCGR_PEP_ID=MMETSP0127-20121128/15827_1 /TAXON_ID=938130 /ORGANISM="Platyophrya macrostoma, Strain WH" /LENGTH=170 /DNA_ID=CAMNT_0017815475 /DNA_START=145 /DNA_END=660 /DNA_ORIENTATION=+